MEEYGCDFRSETRCASDCSGAGNRWKLVDSERERSGMCAGEPHRRALTAAKTHMYPALEAPARLSHGRILSGSDHHLEPVEVRLGV